MKPKTEFHSNQNGGQLSPVAPYRAFEAPGKSEFIAKENFTPKKMHFQLHHVSQRLRNGMACPHCLRFLVQDQVCQYVDSPMSVSTTITDTYIASHS